MTLPRGKTIPQITPDEWRNITDEEMQQEYMRLMSGNKNQKAAAKLFQENYMYYRGLKKESDQEDYQNSVRNDTKKANDPVRQVMIGSGSTLATTGVLWGVNEAMKGAAPKVLPEVPNIISATRIPSYGTTAVEGANAANTGVQTVNAGTTAVNAVPSTPVVVSGSYLPEAGTAATGAGEAGAAGTEAATASTSAALPVTVALIGGQILDHYASKQKQDTKNANVMFNPVGTFNTNLKAAPKIFSGEELSDDELLAMSGGNLGLIATAGASSAIPLTYRTLFEGGHGVFGSSKGKEQLDRDRLRGGLEKAGMLADDDVIRFSDGTEFSLYKDGGARLKNFGTGDDRYSDDQRHFYDVDFTNPNAEKYIQDIDPLALALLPEDMKLKSDLTGYLVNAVSSGDEAGTQQRTKEVYNQFFGQNKQDPQQTILATLEDRFNNGLITKDQFEVAKATTNRVFGYPSFGVS